MSGQFASLLLNTVRHVRPAGRDVSARLGGLAAIAFVSSRKRLAKVDLVSASIGLADAVEAGIVALGRAMRFLVRHRGVGLTGGLVWRGLAALTGIGLTASLVTAMSSVGSQASLSTLTIQPGQEQLGKEQAGQEQAGQALRPIRDVRQEPRPVSAAGEAWTAIVKPVAMFGLDSPELERHTPLHEAKRNPAGVRQDSLTFGGFSEARAHLHLRLRVEHAPPPSVHSFVVALVREAAQGGMSVQRSGSPNAIATRFGPVETADVTLSDGEASRACIAFRKSAGEMPLDLSGWWCGGASRPADRQQLICLIDRLDLVAAGDDKALRGAFARTELNRQPACAPPRLSATGRKTSWLDADGQAPALKTATRR